MKKFDLILGLLLILLLFSIPIATSVYCIYKLNHYEEYIDEQLIKQRLENDLIKNDLNSMYIANDLLSKKLIVLEDEFKKSTKKSIDYSNLNQYSSKNLPTELVEDNGWIQFCGTKYNPVPEQCYGDGKRTSTGKWTDSLIANENFLFIAITKSGLNHFKMHDTVRMEYMNKYGDWLPVTRNGKVMKGIIEDRMNTNRDKYYCLDILSSKEQMSEISFTGLAKIRIKKI